MSRREVNPESTNVKIKTICLRPEVIKKVQKLAQMNRRSFSWVVGDLLETVLNCNNRSIASNQQITITDSGDQNGALS